MNNLNREYVSSSHAAKRLGIHPLAIQKLIYRGTLPAEKIANRWIIPKDALEKLAKTYVPRRGRPSTKK